MNGEGSGMLSQPCEEDIKAGWVVLGNDRFGISSLTLERYRCFKKLDIEFDPNLTIISAPNGEGKTAILDAVAISLRFFIDTLQKRQSSLGFTKDDIQLVAGADGNMENYLPHEPTKLSAEAWFLGEKVNWTRKLKSMASSAKTITEDGSGLSSIALELLRAIQPDSTINEEKKSCILPMMSYYGTGRLFSQIKASNAKQSGRSRLDGYEDCLNPNSSYKAFLAWYGPMSSEAQAEIQSGLIAGHRAQERVKAVSGVIQKVLEPTGWKGIRWDFVNREPKAYHSDGRTFPVRLLSDGVRNMLAMAADMAFRCSQLNPQLGENVANETPGIVLIDEIDMHLHPEWQQSVLSRLMTVFPKIQFLVSTHSPEVISTFKKEHIRVVNHGQVMSPCYQTSGVPSDIILANVMGVDPVWGELEAAKWLTRYHALISQGFDKTEESAMLRTKIIDHYGINSQQILECDQAIRLTLIRNKISSRITKVS